MAELGARALTARGVRPDRWDVGGLDEQELRMGRVGRAGGADVVFIGSSTVGAGLDPEQLAAASAAYRSAFNAWIPGASARALAFVAQQLAVPALDPEVVVIGVTPRELNDHGPRQLDMLASLRGSPAFRHVTGTATTLQRMERRASGVSHLLRLRRVIRNPRALAGAVVDGDRVARRLRKEEGPRALGMAPERGSFRIVPGHLEQEREALLDYSHEEIELPALAALVDALVDRGIRVVVVDVPVYEPVYIDLLPGGAPVLRRYRAELRAAVERAGAEYLRAGADAWSRSHFADENHLNESGAARLTEMLAAHLDGTRPSTDVLLDHE